MQSLNIHAVNTVNFSGASAERTPFRICWIAASHLENRDLLNYRFHRHAFWEIHFIINGSITYETKDRTLTVEGGEYLVVPPKREHRVMRHSEDFEKLTLAMEVMTDSDMEESLFWLSGKKLKIDGDVEALLDAMLRQLEKKGRYRTEMVRLSLESLVLGIAAVAGAVLLTKDSEGRGDDRWIKARMFIEDNYDTVFSCEEVAGHCHISVKQLGRLFKKYEGMGLLEFIHFTKLQAAKRLLKDPLLSQHQIAEALGFSDVHYFRKFFTRLAGESPASFRKKQWTDTVR